MNLSVETVEEIHIDNKYKKYSCFIVKKKQQITISNVDTAKNQHYLFMIERM